MKIKSILLGLMVAIYAEAGCNSSKIAYDITTGGKTGTYYQIGLNLAKFVAPDACIKLKVLNSNGSLDNALKLNSPNNIKFAIVQNDVLQQLKVMAKKGNKKAADLVKNLRVLWPLYNEEIHIITAANSDIKNFADLKNKKISIGKAKSGTAMTSFILYKDLFGEDMKAGNYKAENFDNALRDLGTGKIDAIVKVAGQPVKRLSADMSAESKKYIKLATYDENNPNHKKVTSYYKTIIKASSYPWLDKDTSTLSTKSYLITYNYRNSRERKYLKKFIESFREKLAMLKEKASKDSNTPHLKWKEVSSECAPNLPGGWKYYDLVHDICKASNNKLENGSSSSAGTCDERSKVLGLCN